MIETIQMMIADMEANPKQMVFVEETDQYIILMKRMISTQKSFNLTVSSKGDNGVRPNKVLKKTNRN